MKKSYLIILAAIAAFAGWWFFFRKPKAPANNPAANNTGSAKQPLSYQNLWGFANDATLKNTTAAVTSAYDGLKALSNIFGINDGGAKPGVSISGSDAGGTQSSGGGAGLPGDTGDDYIPDSWYDSNFSELATDSPQTA